MKNNYYNPDVLSCLANLSNDEVFTPPNIANRMLDLLPEEIWSDETVKFLDAFTKSGVFLREITLRLMLGLKKKFPNDEARLNHILSNQVFGIAITRLTSLLARRTLYCSKAANGKYSIFSEAKNSEGNIKFDNMSHTWKSETCVFCGVDKESYDRNSSLDSYAYQFIHTNQPEKVFNMKFDVIIGNPPYQLASAGFGAQARPIYQLFVQQAKKMKPRYICMIIPARWFDGGMGLDEFRNDMINDRSLKTIVDCPKLFDVFPGVEIKGGVCYFLMDSNHNGDCEFISMVDGKEISNTTRDLRDGDGVIIRNNEAISILDKIRAKTTSVISKKVSSINPFNFATNFTDYQKIKKENDVEIFLRTDTGWINKSQITKNTEWIDLYKVITPKAGDGHGRIPMKVIGEPKIIPPNSVCSMTYIVLDTFKNENEAQNFCNYIKTKFVRFLISLRKSSQNVSRDVFLFVPKLNMSQQWTDELLYEEFQLMSDDIEYIESQIMEMN